MIALLEHFARFYYDCPEQNILSLLRLFIVTEKEVYNFRAEKLQRISEARSRFQVTFCETKWDQVCPSKS